MTDHSKAKSHSGVSATKKVANETSNANGLCKAMSAVQIQNTCNVCGKPCTKQCALCRSVFYCSAECQRLDWKRGHKKNCKGKQKKKKKKALPALREAEKTIVAKASKKHVTSKDNRSLTLESLPDEVLVYIGKTVLELCSVPGYLALASTSKRFHSLLTDSKAMSNVINEEGGRILQDSWERRGYTICPIIFPKFPDTLEEIRFWQIASELIKSNKIYFGENVDADDCAQGNRVLSSIGKMLDQFPNVQVILDTHSGLYDAEDESYALGMKICLDLVFVYKEDNPGVDAEWLAKHFYIRPWGAEATKSAMDVEGSHQKHLEKGKAWVDVFFRVEGGIEFPPRSILYGGLDKPEWVLFGIHYNGLGAIGEMLGFHSEY